ncbi:MAG: LuxR C-terminal-related transcriptional regulator [Bacteroidetes bacterium]|nr:LuxR C-terminal-related transcriptional regulator [Bacteroidota bacterium]
MSVHFVFFSALFISLIFFISTAGKIENKKRKSALQWFGVFFLSYITLQLLHRVGDYSGILGLNVQMIIISCLVFTFYITQVLFMNKFFNYYNSPGIKESAIDFSILASKFGITNREKDIIKLVCEGKTNKEIGEELFITSITVRDHLSNIFRKTNVKRRVQLANLFRVNLSRKDKT